MATSAEIRTAYRSILREIARSSIHPPGKRNHAITRNIRVLFEEASKVSNSSKNGQEEVKDKLLRDIRNAVAFLRSQRIHKELLDRYNPLRDLTQEERVKATAKRVGLDVPIEAKEGQSEDK